MREHLVRWGHLVGWGHLVRWGHLVNQDAQGSRGERGLGQQETSRPQASARMWEGLTCAKTTFPWRSPRLLPTLPHSPYHHCQRHAENMN